MICLIQRSFIRGVFIFVLVLSAVFSCCMAPCSATPAPLPEGGFDNTSDIQEEIIKAQLEALDTSFLSGFLEDMDSSMEEFFPGLDLAGFIRSPGRVLEGLDPASLAKGILRAIAAEVRASLALLGQLIILAVMCGILSEFASGFETQQITTIARSACFMVLALMATNSFFVTIRSANEAVDSMTGFMHASTPLLFALLSAVGGITSAAVMSPVVVAVAGVASSLVRNIVFPLLFLSAVLEVVSIVADRVQLTQFSGLARDVAVGFLGGGMTLFLGVMTIRGVGARVADSVSIRTAKFVSGTFIPVVGKMFSDAVGMVASCAALIHGGLSVVGFVSIFMICLVPAAKILSVAIMYRLAGAIVQPLGDPSLPKCLSALGNTLILVLVTVGVVAVAFLAVITVISGLVNFAVTLR
jgi:stage III sporulation protein AE